jgi:nicotinamidase-related amidase
MGAPSLLNTDNSVLMVIDIQDRLLAAMSEGVQDRITRQASVLLTASNTLNIPVIVTEQYPKGLGHTHASLQAVWPEQTRSIEKTSFSALKVDAVKTQLEATERKQIILMGMETHICILQTALDLLAQGYEVFVVEDAVSSRADSNQSNALQRMSHAGIVITNTESALFEWLGDAKYPDFKTLSKLIV